MKKLSVTRFTLILLSVLMIGTASVQASLPKESQEDNTGDKSFLKSGFKGGFFVTAPKKEPEIKIEEKKMNKWNEMKTPKLWSTDNLKDHPFYAKVSSEELPFVKFILWYSHLWNKEKRLQYLQIAITLYPLTSMPSYNGFTDLRLELLYTLNQCPPELPVLEIGGGFGFMARNMLVLNANLTIVDLNQEKLEYTRKHIEQHKEFFSEITKNYTHRKPAILRMAMLLFTKKCIGW